MFWSVTECNRAGLLSLSHWGKAYKLTAFPMIGGCVFVSTSTSRRKCTRPDSPPAIFVRPSGAKAQLKIRPSPVKVIVSSALCNPHPQRPVTRARDGARALDDQLLLHGKARPLCGQDARGMHLTTLRFIRGWRQIQMTPPAIRSACFAERPSTERLQTS